eukprot:TRINITY_DN28_c0_g1_i1.p2 TRINITY_DN28_c0_g1~~TRINITY_DN28_c0_g1_i1.p2  ORF type:complete len:154 (-),score=49.77 TRINITY_DN28_c0_g1_i1:59-520(-)
MDNNERTFIAIKPDGVQRKLVGEIISRFERKGYKLVAMKLIKPSTELAQKHYEDLKDKPFFKSLVEYFTSGPVCAMVWEGIDVVAGGRRLIGATNPRDSAPGTIRFDYCLNVGRNLIHGSDSVQSSAREISTWFTESEISVYTDNIYSQVYEK